MMKENAEVAVREMLKEIAIKVKVRFCINNTYVIIIMMDILYGKIAIYVTIRT